MTSIRSHLTLRLLLPLGLLLLLTGAGIYLTARHLLHTGFDATLLVKARTVITATEVDDGRIQIDDSIRSFLEQEQRDTGDYYEIRRPDGRTVRRSSSLGAATLSIPSSSAGAALPAYRSLPLPDGHPGRAVSLPFTLEDDDLPSPLQLHLIFASDSGEMEAQLATLGFVLFIAGLGCLIVTILVVRSALSRGLRPLQSLARQVTDIQPASLDTRFPPAHYPQELRPVTERLNDLFDRLESAFSREQRFTSHVAHELRTPLAELRLNAEMGIQWPQEATPERMQELLGITLEMQALVEKLLSLSRAESGSIPISKEPLHIPIAVQTELQRHEMACQKKQLTLTTHSPDATLHTDPILWNAILHNLVSNAVHYSPAGSTIQLRVTPGGISVRNPAPQLNAKDLPHLFDRFWRKEEARTSSTHAGIGLSLVRAFAGLLHGGVQSRLEGGQLTIEVTW